MKPNPARDHAADCKERDQENRNPFSERHVAIVRHALIRATLPRLESALRLFEVQELVDVVVG